MKNLPIDWDSVPDVMNKDQFYRLCHISKSTALHLLKGGKVPCEWTGKKTRCYMEVRQVNTASTISQRDAYKLMLKDYPDVMSIEQMCEILSISTKTGYRILREGKILSLKVGRAYRIPKAHLFTYLCIGCGETVNA